MAYAALADETHASCAADQPLSKRIERPSAQLDLVRRSSQPFQVWEAIEHIAASHKKATASDPWQITFYVKMCEARQSVCFQTFEIASFLWKEGNC